MFDSSCDAAPGARVEENLPNILYRVCGFPAKRKGRARTNSVLISDYNLMACNLKRHRVTLRPLAVG